MIVDVYEGDEDEVLPVTRDELGNLVLSSELCGMRGDCNDLSTVRVATCHILPGDADNYAPHCSACGAVLFAGPYCPNCGRKVVSND